MGRGRPRGIKRPRMDVTLDRGTIGILDQLRQNGITASRAIDDAVRIYYREIKRRK